MSENEEKTSQQPSLRGAVAGTGSSYQEALFGLMGGVVYGLTSPLVGHPLDTIKSKMVSRDFLNYFIFRVGKCTNDDETTRYI